MLTWKIFKQEVPFGPKHVAYLGAIPAGLVREDEKFEIDFSLPPRRWRGEYNDSFLTGYEVSYARLATAKAAVERIVVKWLSDAKLKRAK